MFCFPSPGTCRNLIAPATITHTGVCRCKSLGPARSQHGAVGGVTSSESLSELLLLLLSSSPTLYRGKERRTSITRDPDTPFAV